MKEIPLSIGTYSFFRNVKFLHDSVGFVEMNSYQRIYLVWRFLCFFVYNYHFCKQSSKKFISSDNGNNLDFLQLVWRKKYRDAPLSTSIFTEKFLENLFSRVKRMFPDGGKLSYDQYIFAINNILTEDSKTINFGVANSVRDSTIPENVDILITPTSDEVSALMLLADQNSREELNTHGFGKFFEKFWLCWRRIEFSFECFDSNNIGY